MLPVAVRKWNYGHYSSNNYGAHTQAVQVGNLTLYFSYDTVVAFKDYGHNLRVSENAWTTTTGKHLNWLEPVKERRLPSTEFEEQLKQVLAYHKLTT